MERVRPATGLLAGTGAALNVSLGFRPAYVRLVNETQLSTAEAFDGMADARAVVTDDSGAAATDILLKTTNGITFTSQGFQIGTEATINTTSDVIWYLAF